MSKTFLFAAGGTGGHIVPAIALADALRKQGVEVFFVGTGRELERRLTEHAGYELLTLPSVAVSGKGLIAWLHLCVVLPRALFAAIKMIRKRRPALIMGFGGFPSFAPVLAGLFSFLPRVILEPNVQVGLANKVLSIISNLVFAVPGANGFCRRSRVRHIPNPVREDISQVAPWQAPANGEPFRLLVLGGSQGAVTLNFAVLELLKLLASHNIHVVHQTGAVDFERVKASYQAASFSNASIREFINDLAAEYARAHLVVARAGAMTVAEITAAGRPAIFVPLALAGAHQQKNVELLVARGGARLVPQGPDLAKRLATELELLLGNHAKLSQMAQVASAYARVNDSSPAELMVKSLLEIAKGR